MADNTDEKLNKILKERYGNASAKLVTPDDVISDIGDITSNLVAKLLTDYKFGKEGDELKDKIKEDTVKETALLLMFFSTDITRQLTDRWFKK